MESDVCKHCTHAGCLDVCPTGALFRTEFGTVVVQEDVCNGCGYCVPACPFGVHRPAAPARSRRRAALAAAAREEGGRPRLEVHALLRPAEGRPRAGVREGVPDATRSSSASSTSCASARERAAREARGRGLERRRASTATTRTTASAASARSSCCSTSRRSTACRPTRWCRRKHLPRAVADDRARRGGDGRRAARRVPRRRSRVTRVGRVGRTTAGRSSRSRSGQPEIPFYLFTGGLAGGVVRCCTASRALTRQRAARAGDALRRRRRRRSSRRSLLISDLGRPERFLNMLRVFKVTSPMSVGSWVLVVSRRRVERPPPRSSCSASCSR